MARKKNKNSGALAIAGILGAPALLDGEDPDAYEALRQQFLDHVKPADIFEHIYVNDIVDLQWELMRWRRLGVALMNGELYVAAKDNLGPTIGVLEAKKLYDGCRREDPESIENLKMVVEVLGPSMDQLAAQTLARRLDPIERINDLIATAETRRMLAIRQLGEHREVFSKLLKGAIATVEGVAYKEVRPADNDGEEQAGEAKAA